MGPHGGTVPYDAELQEAKRILSARAAPLYNKGGPMFVGEEDMKDIKSGATRRRN